MCVCVCVLAMCGNESLVDAIARFLVPRHSTDLQIAAAKWSVTASVLGYVAEEVR